MKELTERRRQIAAGESGLPLDVVAGYRAAWRARGFELPELQGPSLLQKAGNFAREAAAHVGDKLRRVSQAIRDRRLNICRKCELYNRGYCRHPRCGCPMGRKTWWASTECPIGRWGKQT